MAALGTILIFVYLAASITGLILGSIISKVKKIKEINI